jgi:hypothetical protein
VAVRADANQRWKQGPVVEAAAAGSGSCTALYRSSGQVGWAKKWAERAGTGEVLDGRPGGGRELGGAEVMEAKRGKLESDVHPL